MFLYCHIVAPELGRCSYNKGYGIGAIDACTQQQGRKHLLEFVAGSMTMTHAVGAHDPAEMASRIGFESRGARGGDAQENRRARFAELILIAHAEIERLGEQ